jgi:hypothetical protein
MGTPMNSKLEGLIRAFDALVALRDVARPFIDRGPRDAPGLPEPPSNGISEHTMVQGVAGQIENRLTNVVVAALKEAFDRDHARLELERAHLDAERRRAEAALRAELRRQAADREVGRLRLIAGAALFGWVASLVLLLTHVAAASVASRVVTGGGWVLLLAAMGSAFDAERRIAALASDSEQPPAGGGAGTLALWLLLAGLAVATIGLIV